MVSFDKDKLAEQIESLKKLPQINEVKALRKRLEKELVRFEKKRSYSDYTNHRKTKSVKIKQIKKISQVSQNDS